MDPVVCTTESWLPLPYRGGVLFHVVKIFDSCSVSLGGPMTGTWQARRTLALPACVFRIPLLWEEHMKLWIAACRTALVCFQGRDQRRGRGERHTVHFHYHVSVTITVRKLRNLGSLFLETLIARARWYRDNDQTDAPRGCCIWGGSVLNHPVPGRGVRE